MRKLTTALLVLVAGLSCSKDSGTGPKAPPTITIVPESSTVNLFDHLQLQAVIVDSKGDTLNEAVGWTSQSPNVVFISPGGLTEGLTRGTATILADADGAEASARVKVKITVIQIQLHPTGGTLQVGDTQRVKDTLITANGQLPDDSLVAWSSSDTAKAVVSSSGLVTARAQGSVTIFAKVDSASASVGFTVPEPVTKIVLSAHLDTLRQDSTVYVAATDIGTSNDTLLRPVTWSSSDTSIAKFSGDGYDITIGAYKPGRAVIRAQIGSVLDSCVVIVVRPSVATVQITPATDTLLSDSSVTFSATVRDSVGVLLTDRPISWTSSDSAVATVTTGGVATAHAAGKARIRAAAGAKVDSATLVSIRPTVAKLVLRPDTGHILARQSIQITALMTDSVGDSLTRTPTWTSLTPAFATVTSTGLIVGVGPGPSVVLAQIDGKTDTARIGVDTVFAHPAQVLASQSSTCVRNADGRVSCWGANLFGETGHLPDSSPCDTLQSCEGTPIAINSGLSFTSIVAGERHVCGLVAGGQAYCWGDPAYGQIGNGTTALCFVNVPCTSGPIPLNGGLTFLSIAAGEVHTCGIATDSTAWCWGDNSNYQLGGDSMNTGPHDAPVPVYGGLKFSSLALGAGHSCGLTSDGTAYCWGLNDLGELGIDSANPGFFDTRVRVPTKVLGEHAFVELVAGWYHNCGRLSDGSTYCWGSNGYGTLGNGTTTVAWLPVLIPNGVQFGALAAGHLTTCGITTGGTAECWGNNDLGQLGTGTYGGQSNSPVPVTGPGTFAALSLGGEHTCGISVSGIVYCWGDNGVGQVGIGPVTIPVPNPTPVIGQP
ncbi:MAG TPA: Ig-like domain-containing protein [Gemmatimonadales bacterium]|nr:Ig-like domain-containing protein [Gemmatimonadales bacterium]